MKYTILLCWLLCGSALQAQKTLQVQKTQPVINRQAPKPEPAYKVSHQTTDAYTKLKVRLPFSTSVKEFFVQKIGHFFVLNGDIIVGNDFPKTMSYSHDDVDYRWPNATLPIVVDPSIYANNLGDEVHTAVSAFNTLTELCLVPRTTEDDYIRIVFSNELKGAGLSDVGRQGGAQSLFLASSATKGTVMHELMHAAGFYHEQCREDRDRFVRIKIENLQPGTENNFQMEGGVARGNYDYCSIMHYSSDAFSKNKLPTIECVQNGMVVGCPSCVGNRINFSEMDIAGIDAFYNNVSRFPCHTNFPDPTYIPKFAPTGPSVSETAMAAFRHRAEAATKAGFAGAYPNFHEAKQDANIVGGTIFLKSAIANWQDVSLAELGNPSLNDFGARMRATQDFASRNGFLAGFPTFFHADYGKGTVCGTVLIGNAGADWRDVPLTELGNPALDDIGARMRSANDYAVRNGYLSGFPNFYHADYGKGIVCGIILIKKSAGEWRDVIITEGLR